MKLEFDHVIVAVVDLDAAARRFQDEYGLSSVDGGRHTGLGTANRIVPLGTDYLELMAVVDEPAPGSGFLAEWVRTQSGDGERLSALCLRTDDIEEIAARLGEPALAMQRERPDGEVLRWELVGLQDTLADPSLPFFIQWRVSEDLLPGRTKVDHSVTPSGISWVELGGSRDQIRDHVGDARLDLRLVEGPPGLRAVGIATSDGEIRLD